MDTDKYSDVAAVAKQKRVVGESACGVDREEKSLHPCSSVVNIKSAFCADSRRAPVIFCR